MSNENKIIIENVGLASLVIAMGTDGVLLVSDARVDEENPNQLTFTVEKETVGFDAVFKDIPEGVADDLYAFAVIDKQSVIKLTEESYKDHMEVKVHSTVETPLVYRATC